MTRLNKDEPDTGIVATLFDLSFQNLLLTRIFTVRTVRFLYLLSLAGVLLTQIKSLVQTSRTVEDPLAFLTGYLPIWFLVFLLNIFLVRLAVELVLVVVMLVRNTFTSEGSESIQGTEPITHRRNDQTNPGQP
ncbi:hypothetical protein Mterra_00667 [Calidithermus terrae]|uniref:DUF4282 domain-containing protein n=1 Tax=Calidithermus terrae TaxID=1408545 RepID=A0A399F234_9DEIN|nr:hypothetical protein [Calidithermus terrae]RIH90050.1 hypothetical protein Mterra_00667 [Calidithermus terrae]